jgi:hypothetical protein
MLKRRLKEPFGKAGLTVGIIALVLALVGGAYAAGGLTKSQEKQVKKIAKKFAGKPGAPGANGTNGATGPEGPLGTNGKNGTNGKSVALGTATAGPGEECEEGGTTVEVEGSAGSKKYVCNGSPWTAGGTLPSEQTLKGDWSLLGNASGYELEFEEGKEHLSEEVKLQEGGGKLIGNSVSFVLPLAVAPTRHYINANGKEPFLNSSSVIAERSQPACPGNKAEPAAEPGNLCVYAAQESNVESSFAGLIPNPSVCSLDQSANSCIVDGWQKESAAAGSRFGFGIEAVSASAGPVGAFGTWAVTAE